MDLAVRLEQTDLAAAQRLSGEVLIDDVYSAAELGGDHTTKGRSDSSRSQFATRV
jgi:hypothetical protein